MLKKSVSFILVLLMLLITREAYSLDLNSMKKNMLLGDYKSAITEGEKLIAKNPHSDELYYLMGLCYLKDGNYLRASDIFEVIINEFSGSKFKEEAVMGLGDTYFLREDFDKAREVYQGILKNNPDSKLKAQAYYRLSEVGFKKGDTGQAKDYLTKIKESYPLALELKASQDSLPVEKNNVSFYYSVQIGSFSSSSNAQNLTEKLLKSGYPAYLEEGSNVRGGKVYRVRVGKLQTRQEAENLTKKLVQEGYPTKIFP